MGSLAKRASGCAPWLWPTDLQTLFGRRGNRHWWGFWRLGLWLCWHSIARGGGGRRAPILCAFLGRSGFGFSRRRAGIAGRDGRSRVVFVFCRGRLNGGALFLLRLGIGRRLRTRRRRLGAGIDEHRLPELLQWRGALRLRRAQTCKEDAVRRLGIVIGHHIVLVFGRRPLAVTAAHVLAQIRRRGSDRLQRLDRAEWRREPRQGAIAVKAALQQLRRFQGAGRRGRSAEHHGDESPAIARRGGDEIETRGADEAGLHAVGAGIAADQRIVVPPHHLPHAYAGEVPVVIVFRQFADERTR